MATELERWAPELANDLARVGKEAESYLVPEAEHLATSIRRVAPVRSRALLRSIVARELDVSALDYATLQSEGGTVKALHHGWLTIPVRPGYTPSGGYVTVKGRDGNQYVIRSGTMELWAARRRSVRIRGTQFLRRGLDDHLAGAGDRIAKRITDEVT